MPCPPSSSTGIPVGCAASQSAPGRVRSNETAPTIRVPGNQYSFPGSTFDQTRSQSARTALQ